SGLYRSDDWGQSWANAGSAIAADHVDALLAPPGRPDDVYAVAGGSVWSSNDAARSWQRRTGGVPGHGVEAVGFDSTTPARLWAVGSGQVFRSDHPGERWRPVGKPVPETLAMALAMAISGEVIVIATDRGVFRSADGGERWELPKEGLPAHLAARVLVGDSRSPTTLYAGLAVDVEGRAWYTEAPKQSISRASPDGAIASFGLSTPVARLGRLTVGPDNTVWFAEPTVMSVTRLRDGRFTRYVMGTLTAKIPADAAPFGVASAPDGAVWATLPSADQL